MKKLFLAIIAVFSLSISSFAQEARVENKATLEAGKKSGDFTFYLPESISADDVTQNSKYYTHYFTVNFDDASSKADIKMITNDEKSRHVIVRFLVSLGIEQVVMDGKAENVEAFYQTHLK